MPNDKLGFQPTWAMAVGGMVGGGIFSTAGVVIAIAGSWAWLSFVTAGLVALATAYSYAHLSARYAKSGGAFTFLREVHADQVAGSLAWILIAGYVLTNAVYAYTFGVYLAEVVDLGTWFPRLAAASILAFFIALNLRGAGRVGGVELFLVWAKLTVLGGLAVFGIARWEPSLLSEGTTHGGFFPAIFGAASIFMAYEGFELLGYDYNDIQDPAKTLPRALLTSVISVTVVYVAVVIGVPMLVGAGAVIEHREVALSIAGREALGTSGVVLVTIAAAFSTGSAINATLFATARLARDVASKGELPPSLARTNSREIPGRAVIVIGLGATVLAVLGNLTVLVEVASLAFLGTFATICLLAFLEDAGLRLITGLGAVLATLASLTVTGRLVVHEPYVLAACAVVTSAAVVGRPLLLRRLGIQEQRSDISPID